MSHVVPIVKVNQFLPHEKLELSDDSEGHDKIRQLETTAKDIVFSTLSTEYETDSWNLSTTPSLVANIIGMLVAGWLYDRQFAEEAAEGNSYGTRKVNEAYSLLQGILDNKYELNADIKEVEYDRPTFLTSEPYFTMGARF